MSAEETAPGSLAYTPTWAVAVVCFIIISISVCLEKSIHHLMDWLKRRHKTMLCEALVRVKSQFMLLGFLSILLTVTQGSIQKICIPAELANKMLPCGSAGGLVGYAHDHGNDRFSRLLFSEENNNNNSAGGRGEEEAGPCSSKGKVSFITTEGVEQLQQFLFVLAATQC